MSDLEKINTEQELYVLRCGTGFTSLGFTYAYQQGEKLAKWLLEQGEVPCTMMVEALKGTEPEYQKYTDLHQQASALCAERHIRCDIELEPQLLGLEGCRVEVVDCYDEKRRFWVGKSTGWMPVHLEVPRTSSSGGMAAMGTPYKSVEVVRRSERR